MTRTAMADRVAIGQTWRRRRDSKTFSVHQVWRPDRQVLLAPDDGAKIVVSFSDLRRLWELIVPRMTTRERVIASLLAEDGRDTHHATYAARRQHSEVKKAPMRPAGVRKMRVSRKRYVGRWT